MILSKKEFIIFLIIIAIITLPFLLLAVFQPACNESTMIFMLHFILGLPWIFLYKILPFNIPGFTSAPINEINSCVGVFETFLFYIPIYINLFILIKIWSTILKYLKK